MNIGKWIVVTFVCFAIFIASLVVICVREDISLVSPNYYAEELVYQDQIDRLNNTAALPQKPSIRIVDHTVRVDFKQQEPIEGAVLRLFCPSDQTMDRSFPITTVNGKQTFALGTIRSGMYRVKLNWVMQNKAFYWEEEIYI